MYKTPKARFFKKKNNTRLRNYKCKYNYQLVTKSKTSIYNIINILYYSKNARKEIRGQA